MTARAQARFVRRRRWLQPLRSATPAPRACSPFQSAGARHAPGTPHRSAAGRSAVSSIGGRYPRARLRLRRTDPLSATKPARARPPDLVISFPHRNAMSFMHPRTLRSAALARMTLSGSRSVNMLDGRPSAGSSRLVGRATREPAARRPDALTSAPKIEQSVAARVRSKHLRRLNHNRFARPGAVFSGGCATARPCGVEVSSWRGRGRGRAGRGWLPGTGQSRP